jgi:hypothetical protein
MKSETLNSMGISLFDKAMALRALMGLGLYIYCIVHSRGCKLLPI